MLWPLIQQPGAVAFHHLQLEVVPGLGRDGPQGLARWKSALADAQQTDGIDRHLVALVTGGAHEQQWKTVRRQQIEAEGAAEDDPAHAVADLAHHGHTLGVGGKAQRGRDAPSAGHPLALWRVLGLGVAVVGHAVGLEGLGIEVIEAVDEQQCHANSRGTGAPWRRCAG